MLPLKGEGLCTSKPCFQINIFILERGNIIRFGTFCAIWRIQLINLCVYGAGLQVIDSREWGKCIHIHMAYSLYNGKIYSESHGDIKSVQNVAEHEIALPRTPSLYAHCSLISSTLCVLLDKIHYLPVYRMRARQLATHRCHPRLGRVGLLQ